ncbi:peptidoglycan-binding domain-containing protein [Phaeobacter sp. QD34_3]|uniref:peptidoglycan-binding domain-containing protein n=1 Tax=unclassified Phaeobacter TaxID=2621772 RepID=UPI00237F5847|nr:MULTISPECIES: peptidoglycan-binding domain-containing protein [unclassified Phaeobacter]MDE4131849.1 peptidoglycan-binding domain-containing protein [Phaeobacter sp. QD34_3]MDE4135487.1 peptidoglycan-binding domain-containing protein [Phaeobacter sp. QD34_24]MDE4173476.1 peptidoglycan-binding domain-containing protein [Phaeobacter sp. PT47_59]
MSSRSTFPFRAAALALLVALTACTAPSESDRPLAPTAPPGAEPGSCWDRHISPAVIETVTVQVLVEPELRAPDGQILQPAVFRTETRQDIVRPRSQTWLQITCPVDMTPDFIASLQRALAVRGDYTGAITGSLDRPTRQAILRYQRRYGLESQLLSLESARRLGLISVAN